jgi:hypothetical protein
MKSSRLLALASAAALALLGAGHPTWAQTLNVVTAGDQNMVDYVNNYLGPKFEAQNPGVKVRAVGTGPGDAGSQKIYENSPPSRRPAPPRGIPMSRSCISVARRRWSTRSCCCRIATTSRRASS